MELYGQTISKVYHKKDGSSVDKKGKSWNWRLWNIYFDGSDGSFTYFTSGKKPEPFEGMKVAYLKYKEETSVSEKDGKTYINRTIDEIKVSEELPESSQESPAPSQVSTQPKPAQPQKEVDWDAIAFKKCKFGFLKEAFVPFYSNENILFAGDIDKLEQEAERFASMCMRISLDYTTATQKPKQEKDIGDAPEPESMPEDPFGDDMAGKLQ